MIGHENYESRPDGIYSIAFRGKDVLETRLTNFAAAIVAEITVDDGLEETGKILRIESGIRGELKVFELTIAEFDRMKWPQEKLGPSAVVAPGMISDQRVAAAIRLQCEECPRILRVTHTGWRVFSGEWCFMHAGTRIGRVPMSDFGRAFQFPTGNPTDNPNCNGLPGQELQNAGRVGRIFEVEVALQSGLQNVRLPELDPADNLANLIGTTCALLGVADLKITSPLFCALFRAVLGPARFGIHWTGPTGSLKTALLEVGQKFFGQNLSILGSWTSTGNALEALLFEAKDIFAVIDDFAPQGSVNASKLHSAADQVFRAQGNGSGRSRARPDGTRRPSRLPRGMTGSTGEEVPPGTSLQSRTLLPFVDQDSIDPGKLALLQREATKGTFAKVMRAFVDWVAPQMATVQKLRLEQVEHYRRELKLLRNHRRQPDTVADLLFGFDMFTKFAEEAAGVEVDNLGFSWNDVCQALISVAQTQSGELWSSDPVERFPTLLRAALVGGHCHLCNVHGGIPFRPEVWGWKWFPGPDIEDADGKTSKTGVMRPMGRCIGWVDVDQLFLDPEVSLRVAKSVSPPDAALVASLRILKKRLLPYLLSNELGTRETHTIRKTIQGCRREVLHLPCSYIFGETIGENGQSLDDLIDI